MTFFMTSMLPGMEAITDAGRVIALFHYNAVTIVPAREQLAFQSEQERRDFLGVMEQRFLANTNQNPATLVRLAEPNPQSNCHGWIFTQGRFGVPDALVPAILEDNGYAIVQDPREGDLAVFTRDTVVHHSGVVRSGPGGEVLIESKWGPFGVYRHTPEAHPYPKHCTYYRSARRRHLLMLGAASLEAGARR